MSASSMQRTRQLLAAPWLWRRNESTPLGRWLSGALGVLLVGAPAAAGLWWLPRPLAVIAWLVLGSVVVLVAWGWQFEALLRLDHPHAARLVPGHSHALRRNAIGWWTALMALCGGLAMLAAPAIGGAALQGDWRWPTLAVLGSAAAMLFVAGALRWPWVWLLLFVMPLPSWVPGLRELSRFGTTWAAQQWAASPGMSTAVALLAMAVALAALFGQGNAAHGRAHAARERARRIMRAGANGQKPTLAAYGRWGEVLGAPWQRLYDAWLTRTTQRAQATPASVMARAEVVLHGAQHWLRHLAVMLPLLLGLVLLFTALTWRPTVNVERLFERGHVGMSIGLMSMTLSPLMSLPGALWVSRREQALLLLLPGMPRGVALNRAIAWRQARQFLQMWLLTLPLFALLMWLAKAPQLLAFPLVALLALPWMWRDVARQGPPSSVRASLPFLLALAAAMGAMLLLRHSPSATLPLVATLCLATLATGVWRWRRLGRWPQCLPAGRLN